MNPTWERDPVFGCDLWTGKVGSNGRPIIWRGRTPSSVHKVLFEERFGPVPPDKVLDHLCRRILCVRVDIHVEPVTKHENEMRKSWAYRCKRTHCAHGHSLTSALVTPEMGRLCRDCLRLAS